jgi:hypothetical protein
VNLGETFDLINIKAPAVEFDPNAERAARDDLADKNVTAIALEVPAACLLGRRPGDDVVDIELRVAMGKLCTLNIGCSPADAPAGAFRFTDGAYLDEAAFDATFPYLKTPIPGSPQSASGGAVAARRTP